MSGKFHIDKHGNVARCAADKMPCKAQPSGNIRQFHGDNEQEVYVAIAKQYRSVLKSLRHNSVPLSKVSKIEPVTDELIGHVLTDHERLSVSGRSETKFGVMVLHWLHDVEGRPIAYMKLSEEEGGVFLYDIEVRPEYRGYGLSRRLLRAFEKVSGKKVEHEGGYTAAGLRSVAPLFHDSESLEKEKSQLYDDMSFVSDWDKQLPKMPK